jgi:hypothetical protein
MEGPPYVDGNHFPARLPWIPAGRHHQHTRVILGAPADDDTAWYTGLAGDHDREPDVILLGASRGVMTLNPPGADGDGILSPAALRVTAYLRDRVDILAHRRQLGRISDEVLAMLPALPARHTAVEIVHEATVLLMHGGDSPRRPS